MLECLVHFQDVDDNDKVPLIQQIKTNESYLSKQEVKQGSSEIYQENNMMTKKKENMVALR